MEVTKLEEQILIVENSTKDKIPQTLETFLLNLVESESFSCTQDLRLHIMAALTYYLAIEMGFNPEKNLGSPPVYGFNKKRMKSVLQLPPNFKRQTHFRASLYFPGEDTEFSFVALKTGDSLMITLTSEKFPGGSLLLNCSRYVPFFNKKEPAKSLRNLQSLSFNTKNSFFPVISRILWHHLSVPYNILFSYPTDKMIYRYLSQEDLRNLGLTCKFLKENVTYYFHRE